MARTAGPEQRGEREEILNKLGDAYLHPERHGPDTHELFGRLAKIDRSERERQFVKEALGFATRKETLPAERQLAFRLADHVNSQVHQIDLSQRYQTEDHAVAQARHERAIERLKPLIDKATRLGYSVNQGEAVAAGLGEGLRIGL